METETSKNNKCLNLPNILEKNNKPICNEERNTRGYEKSKIIDPLPPIDHTLIEYDNFEKNFYEEHEEIKNLSQQEVDELRQTLGIKVISFFLSK